MILPYEIKIEYDLFLLSPQTIINRQKRTSYLIAFSTISAFYTRPQLLDIATAAQTDASREALLELLSFEDEDAVDHPQRFLFAAAYSSHPSETLITDLIVRKR